MSDAPAVELNDLSLGFRGVTAVEHATGAFAEGSLTAIAGPNGAGKTTLLRAIVGDVRPSSGHVRCNLPARSIAYLPQSAGVDRRFPITTGDLVMPGLWREIGAWRGAGPHQQDRRADALAAVGLRGFERRLIGTLSVGQFQRALFARLLLQDAQLIVLDEPFAGIDEDTAATLLALLQTWRRDGRTVIAVLHDLAQIRQHFPRTLLLAREVIAWGPTAVVLTPDNMGRARRLAGQWDATDIERPTLRLSA